MYISALMSFLFVLLQLLAPFAMAQQSCKDIFYNPPQFLEWSSLKSEMRAQGLDLPTANHFGLIEATSSISQARVVIVGDAHKVAGDPFQLAIRRAENADRAFLDKFVDPEKDIVLMERFPGSREMDPVWSMFFSHRGIRSEGWDNQKYNHLGHILLNELNQLQAELMQNPPRRLKQSEEYHRLLMLRLAIDHVVIELRDEALFLSIQKQLNTLPADGKIFVVAGTEHAIDHYQILYGYLQDHHVPYVGLRGIDKEIPDMHVGGAREAALDTFNVTDRELDHMVLTYVDDLLRTLDEN